MELTFKNKAVVITGGSSGLGRATAKFLAKMGAKVEICSNDKNGLVEVCRQIKNAGNLCNYTLVDVTVQGDIHSFVKKVLTKHKKIDILINSAGWIFGAKPIEDVSDEEYDKCFDTNMRSIFLFSREILPIMKKQNGGVVINITSTAGIRANPLFAIYSASKFAVRGLTQALGKALENTNISYVSVAPSGMNTPMRRKLFGAKDAKLQQKPEAVARIIADIAANKIKVPNGGEVVVRDGNISAINKPE